MPETNEQEVITAAKKIEELKREYEVATGEERSRKAHELTAAQNELNELIGKTGQGTTKLD